MDDLISKQAAIDALDGEIKLKDSDDVDNVTHYIQQVAKKINELPSAEQRWIPATERLPEEDGGFYLVTDCSKSINRRRIHVSRCYVNNGGFWTDVPLGYKVVAWMPLPEPYKGKDNGQDG